MAGRDQPDAAVLSAALEVSRRLDLVECFQVLIQSIATLVGDGVILGYRYSASGFDLELVVSSLGDDHPLRDKLALLDARVLDDEIPLEGRQLDDLSLLEPASGWGDSSPETTLALPLVSAEERVGLVLILDPPTGEPVARVRDLVRECGPAVRSALTVLDLKDLMVRDDTADCFNRRYFDEYLTGEVARALRFGGRLALIFLDMDNLKDVNTRHGHAAGSQVLYEASVRINRSIRTVDKLFRFGGDEFCIVLPETDAPGANEVAERVRRELSGKPFLTETTPGEPLTASLGVSAFPEHGRNAASLLEAADRAMRQIKDGCKNAIATAGEGEPAPGIR
jgi:diguanylate cyclase (GGDEF)-like protein